jgi:pSer/pThr/pTyr-binding forkhead associated (FHA) protein
MTASAAQVGLAGGRGEVTASGGETAAPAPDSVAPGGGGAATAQRTAIPPSPVSAPRVSSPPRATAIPTRCPRCTKPTENGLPFCGYCGTRIAPAGAGTCVQCGANYLQGVDLFCARCGNRVGQRVSIEIVRGPQRDAPAGGPGSSTQGMLASRRDTQPRIALLDDEGSVAKAFVLERGEAVVGRGDADIRFESDPYMSPLHARIELRAGQLWLRDLGSRNGTWIFIEVPMRLTDGDLVLIGSQILRFRRLGYPGPHPPEADSTRRLGSLVPAADVAVLEQLRADSSVRDTLHLSPGRSVLLGRETGDWLFPYDQTMSGKHAEVRSEDSEYYIHDAGSRNGVAMAVRGERALRRGQRILIGNEILRVESA